ncbi:hypothetical protein AVEN_227521-1 [Araneus ventricosus]|uniref:Uncharacterized protein n=1 Tax=Araneus ventricosus TaxID=182803 RepID=A0A4Y2C3H3_ARAVE|nr:hypothetical protein AVEN_227521-1 [Araneus ventricosus]
MTGHIYEKWLRDLDRRFLSEKRKAPLIVDNCSAHVEVSDLKAIRVEFLSPNVTSIFAAYGTGQTTISKAFQHAGFTTVIEESQENVPDDIGEDELLINELRKRNPLLHEISFQDFLNVDSDVIYTEEITDEQIFADIMNEKEELSDFEQENEITQRPTAKQVAKWLTGLRHIFEGNNNCEIISSTDKI